MLEIFTFRILGKKLPGNKSVFPRPSSRQRTQPPPHNPLELLHEFQISRRPPRLQAFAGPLDDRLVTAGDEIRAPTGNRPEHRDARHLVQRTT